MSDNEGMLEVMPTVTESSSAVPGPDKLSFLSAGWVNERVMNVASRVDKYLERIIDNGLLSDGFAPFESPITNDMLIRMAPEQFRTLFDAEPTAEGKAMLLARMKDLKLPTRELLPFPERPFEPDQSLEREPPITVSSSDVARSGLV